MPGNASEGLFIRPLKKPNGELEAIEVCSIAEAVPTDCTKFDSGTSAFAVAELLLQILDGGDSEKVLDGPAQDAQIIREAVAEPV